MNNISKRKQDHVDLCVNHNMNHKSKTTGLECYEFIHNALPEINYEDISTASFFLNKEIAAPLFISSMTGGFKGAISINQQLAEIASTLNIPLGIGSLRIALHDSSVHDSFTIIKNIIGDTIPLFGNIGAAEIAQNSNHPPLLSILEKCYADAIAIHLNPGDLCLYHGCDLYHWREPFTQRWYLQSFLHYVNANGPYKDCLYDKRTYLGASK